MMSINTRFWVLTGALLSSLIANADAAEKRPIALVEQVSATTQTGLAPFDYVYENDKIDLRPGEQLSLAYFDRCEVETFSGGILRLKTDHTKINKGGVSTKEARPCQTSALRLSKEAREAGVAVKRVTPFPKDEWREVSIAISNPTFIWPRLERESKIASVRVMLLEASPVELIWQSSTENHYLTYPDTAPPLAPGLPYEVIVSYDDGNDISAVFSIDPGLELPEGILTSAVPLGL